MHRYEQVLHRMIGELWLRTMARINSTRYIRDTCRHTRTDRSENFFFDLLVSDVLCPRIPGTLTELKKKERKRERGRGIKKKKKKEKRMGKKRGTRKRPQTTTFHSLLENRVRLLKTKGIQY